MHTHDLSPWTHEHHFHSATAAAERGTRLVAAITLAMMVVEIVAGWWFNSMALLADGIHMGSHAFAIGLTAFAYVAARRLAADPRYAFGTWKIEILGAYTSAVLLLVMAALMAAGAIHRLLAPQAIDYGPALWVAAAGFVVNLLCARILGLAHHHDYAHHHHHDHDHGDTHAGHHADLNLRAAYLHVLADAATSILAMLALTGGALFGWQWLDPVMGLVGAVVVSVWALGPIRQSSRVLLDREMDDPVVAEIREAVETGADQGDTRITDLHVWRVGKRAYAVAVSVVTHERTLTAEIIRQRLRIHDEIAHVTAEIHQCD
ncbi:MAG: CDF family Co(II)/Ni(II) efflux transporter DmeF [Gammaproteobacteria bacterium]|nr:CDF family Co(II)/Ni(II) efflux transporter DmeF [Gammaproteobacteria bacterium]